MGFALGISHGGRGRGSCLALWSHIAGDICNGTSFAHDSIPSLCHGQATMSFVSTRTLAFSGILGISGIQGSWASKDYTSRHDLESSEVLHMTLSYDERRQ